MTVTQEVYANNRGPLEWAEGLGGGIGVSPAIYILVCEGRIFRIHFGIFKRMRWQVVQCS
jgi:hypothetical protein